MAGKQKFARVLLLFSFISLAAWPAAAQPQTASVSGHVKDSAGKPQMGALVEVFTTSRLLPIKAFTDDKGFYRIPGLSPGVYFVKASANAFLPSLRENVPLNPGAHIVDITLSTLVEAFQMVPVRQRGPQEEDDWKFTLRSTANRPILRVLDDDSLVVVSSGENGVEAALKARVAFIAGSQGEGFDTGDMSTAFTVEQSIFSSGTMALDGDLQYMNGQANGVLRASYKHELPYGSTPEFALTARRYAAPDTVLQNAALSAIALSMTDSFTLGEFLEMNYGGELQSVQFRGRVTAFRPFGSATARLGSNTMLQYSYATSQPTTRLAKGFDTAPADLSETNPRVSLQNAEARLERGAHHELALSRRFGRNNLQLAAYTENVRDLALNGVGDVNALALGGDFLPDVYSNTFTYTGGSLHARGIRAVASRKFSDAFTATLNYSFGGVLTAPESLTTSNLAGSFRMGKRHAVTTRFNGTIPGPRTRWIASYKWTSGRGVLTPVDMYNASAGQADPYLNVFLRQPLPQIGFLPGRVEALIDVRNLLAEGYVPVLGQDGRTLYLVQSARSVRGGVAFNF